ncbi:MAG: NosD domain-containing protein [Methanosarcina sp.]|jgi:PGF-pre-PGF domain-containing protein
MEEFDINRIKFLLLTFLILTLSSGIGAAAEVHPGGSIQAAVNSANPNGDTIIVHPGTYTENIDLSKTSNLVLMSGSPNPDDTIIVPKDINKSVISADASLNLVIKGFTIKGAATDLSGIYLNRCRDCTIENNKFLNDALGVYVDSSVNTTIHNNTATRTNEAGKIGRGINVEGSELTTVSSNTISNQRYGIYFLNSQINTASGNNISQCADDGMCVLSSNNNSLESNTVSSNGKKGIYLKGSGKSSLKNNIVSSNGGNGIELEEASGNTVQDNTISGAAKDTNIHGIYLNTCKDNFLQNNKISNCEYGVAISYSENNNLVKNNAHDNFRGFYLSHKSNGNKLSGNKANSNNNGIIITLGANNNILENNEVNLNLAGGIALDNSYSNKIFNNSVSSNSKGIYLLSLSSGNILSGNTVNSNKNDGIILENASENNVTNNIVNQNKRYGIYAVNSNSGYIDSNKVQSNLRKGIYLEGSVNNILSENTVTDNSEHGFFLSSSNDNTLSKNIVYNNKEGISFSSSVNNEISGNKISSNDYGIFMCPRSTENWVYDNYFNNIYNANIKNNKSAWYMEKTPGKNVMGGPTLGGNFWGTPAGLGFSDENSDKDADGNGIIDIPYVSDNGNITDKYPLIRFILPVADFTANPTKGFVPLTVEFTDLSKDATLISWDINGDGSSDNTNKSFVHVYDTPGIYNVILTANNTNGTDSKTVQIIAEEFKVLPVADFSASVTNGYAPLSVQFTDLSKNTISRSWNFGDGATSTDQNPVYIYSTAGTYTVSLAATNENGTASKTATLTVMESSSSGGSSGGKSHRSGGGGGGSPEPARNVQVKELSQVHVANGKPIKFDFAKNATCVVYVTFDAKKTAGKTTAIAEQLKAKSTLVSELNSSEKSSENSSEIYRYFNLWVGNAGFATSKNIENPVICFKVEKSWLQDKNLDKASIKLNRYNDKKWSQLPVKQLKEDSEYLYFTAETPGFSFFAITGEAVEKETVTEKKPEGILELEQNSTTPRTEQESKLKKETGKGKIINIPGFEVLYTVACLVTVFLHNRK